MITGSLSINGRKEITFKFFHVLLSYKLHKTMERKRPSGFGFHKTRLTSALVCHINIPSLESSGNETLFGQKKSIKRKEREIVFHGC